ncbi:MAG: hypothetical protein WBV36_12625 [Terriglobales bacterium]
MDTKRDKVNAAGQNPRRLGLAKFFFIVILAVMFWLLARSMVHHHFFSGDQLNRHVSSEP